jgi:hypothetical protein
MVSSMEATHVNSAARRFASVALAIGCLCAPAICGAQDAPTAAMALQHFENNIAAYLAVRQRASAAAPDLTITSDPAKLERAVNELAERIRTARQHSRPGEIFSDDVAELFRTRIRHTLDARALHSAELLAAIRDDISRTPAGEIAVNRRFDWNSGWEMPPEIVEALPALTGPLEYKLVNRDLLLVDVGADLVVDVLHDAIQRR